jgi:RNA polymerase sigma-70 factor (ECF subfamily)
LYLACGCALALPGAIDAFERCFLPSVKEYVSGIDRAPAFVDEIRQRTRERLLVGRGSSPARIGSYSGRGPLASFVQVVAVRVALNARRATRGVVPLYERDAPIVAADAELRLLELQLGADFRAAFTEALASLDRPALGLLRMHFLDGIPLRTLAARAGADKSTVSRRLKAACALVAAETRRRFGARARVGGSELASVVRALRGQLDHVSAHRLFRRG